MNQRFYKRLPVTWEDRQSLVVRKQIDFRDLDHVSATLNSAWHLEQRFFKQRQLRFNVYTEVRTFTLGGIGYSTLRRFPVKFQQLQGLSPGNISTGIVHPIDSRFPNLQQKSYKGLSQPVVSPIDNDNWPGYGQVAVPGIQFRVGINPNGRVQCTCQVEYRDLISAKNKQKAAWNTVGRSSFATLYQFNVYNSATNSTIIEWNIGNWVPSHIRQTAQTRIDFAY
jgi:hypothetical protein